MKYSILALLVAFGTFGCDKKSDSNKDSSPLAPVATQSTSSDSSNQNLEKEKPVTNSLKIKKTLTIPEITKTLSQTDGTTKSRTFIFVKGEMIEVERNYARKLFNPFGKPTTEQKIDSVCSFTVSVKYEVNVKTDILKQLSVNLNETEMNVSQVESAFTDDKATTDDAKEVSGHKQIFISYALDAKTQENESGRLMRINCYANPADKEKFSTKELLEKNLDSEYFEVIEHDYQPNK